ncbi:CLAP1 protein, partial [Chauna torquata]|nr:CLAP1 protein [Chauna torquata]
RHISVLAETIKKGIHDADSEARIEARKCYWGFHSHFSREAEHLYHTLESSYQKALQSHLKNSDSIVSLPQSDRSSSSSQESLNRPLSAKRSPTGSTTSRASTVSTKSVSTPGSLQRSRSDVDVNAAASAKSKVTSSGASTPFSSAAALPPGSYASLGRIRTRRQSSGSATSVTSTPADTRGRSRAKVVSQSQPGSRSSSPGKLLGSSYGGLSGGTSRVQPVPSSSEKRSKIPRSQGCSRETSPNRIGLARSSRIPRPSMSQGCSRDTSRESSRDTSPARGFPPLASRRHSRSTSALSTADSVGQSDRFGLGQPGRMPASVNAMRVLSTSTDLEAAVADALVRGKIQNASDTGKWLKKKPVRRRYEPYGMYSDDDANSDASSACSERSYGSRNGGIPHYLRQTEDVAEVLNHCASSNWSERKEGLIGLQNLLKSQRTLSRVELKRLCEIFTRMFADPHSKVFSMFLETLVDFIIIHKDDLQDWLFVLLTQLLKKMGADLLGSVQAKVQKALDVTRDSFPFDQQFNILMRFIVDQTQTPNLKVKVAILKYIESLARQMDPTDFVNSSETRLAVSRIITWTTEPKSSDVRKAAQIVLISLFELNTPEFTMLLGALPKTFQDGATKLLHNHLKNSSNTSVGSPSNTLGRTPSRHSSSRTSPLTSPTNCSHGGLSPSMLDYDTENLNSDEIYSSLRGVTEAIEKFSFRSQEDLNEPIKRDGKKDCDIVSRDGGLAVPTGDVRGSSDLVEGGRMALDNKTSLLNTQPPRAFSGPRAREYNPYPYSDTINTYDKTALKEAVFDDDMDQLRDEVPIDHSDLVADLLKELSNHNERVEERKGALLELLKITREDNLGVWEEHFKTILLLLLETLGDKDHSIRALALRVLREILRNQPARFKNYAELTIMKTLEAHKDSHKEVVRAAEEAASTLASSIHPEQCIKVLCPIIQTADYPINLAAIKMQTKVIERISKESLHQLLPDIIPGLLQGYDNTESSVRKASVFCLVAIYSVIGEELKPHLAQLTGSKMKLLNLYIKRAQTTNSNSSSSSDVSTHS